MAKNLKTWIEQDVNLVKDKNPNWLSSYYFFRDPQRHIKQDSKFFFTPADGIILYQERVKPLDRIVQIKGIDYTLQEAFQDVDMETLNPDQEYMVVGIFLSFYDVHVLRMPYSGFVSYEFLEAVESYNFPMLDIEKELMKGIINPNFNNAEYLQLNERMLVEVFSPKINQYYYMLDIADYDVNVILPFNQDQNEPMKQSERRGILRWGSQCDLIIPVTERFDYSFTQNVGDHVEGAIDTLIKISPKNGREKRHY